MHTRRGSRERERESGETRGRANRQGQRLRCPFWSLLVSSVVGDATLKACQLRIALDETKPRKWRRRDREREREGGNKQRVSRSSRINPTLHFLIGRIRRDRGEKRREGGGGGEAARKNTGSYNLWRPRSNMDRRCKFASASRSCHSCVINCPVELGRDSN